MTCGQMSVCACKNPVFILNMVKWIGTTHKNQSSQLLEKKKNVDIPSTEEIFLWLWKFLLSLFSPRALPDRQ